MKRMHAKPGWKTALAAVCLILACAGGEATATEPRTASGGVVVATAGDDLQRALSGAPTKVGFKGVAAHTGMPRADAALQLDGASRHDTSGLEAWVGTGTLDMTAAGGEQLSLSIDVAIRRVDPAGHAIPAPFPVEGTFRVKGGTGHFGAAGGHGRLAGSLLRNGTLVYRLDGEFVTPPMPADLPSWTSPAGRIPSVDGSSVDIVLVNGVRLVARGATTTSRDVLSGSFAHVHQRLLERGDATGLVLPLSLPDERWFGQLDIPGVVPIFIDPHSRSLTLFARAGSAEASFDVVLAGVWPPDGEADGTITLALRQPEFRFHDWNENLQGSVFEDPHLAYATVVLAGRSHTLDTSKLPGAAADFYDGAVLSLHPEFNFHRKIRLYELTRLADSLRNLEIEDTEVVLHGALLADSTVSGLPFPLGPRRQPSADNSVFLEANLPATGPSVSLAQWPAAASERLRWAHLVDRRLTLSHAAGSTAAWILETLEVEIDGKTRVMNVAWDLLANGAPSVGVRLPGDGQGGEGTDWVSMAEASQALAPAAAANNAAAAGAPPKPGRSPEAATTNNSNAGSTIYTFSNRSLGALAGEIRALLPEVTIPPLGDGLPAGVFDLVNGTVEVSTNPPAFSVSATATVLGGVTTEVLISSVDVDGTLGVVVSLKLQQLTLGQIYPGTPAADLQFPAVVLTYLETLGVPDDVTIPSASLSSVARDFYGSVYGEGNEFTLKLEEGVNIVATYPLTQLPSLVISTLRINASDEVVMEGSLGMSLADLATGNVAESRGIYVKATLPTPSSPPTGFPARLQSVQLTELTLELAYFQPEMVARVGTSFEATLDGQTRTFVGSTIVTLGEAPSSIMLVAARKSFSIGATTTLGSRSADLMFSAVKKNGQTQILSGFQVHDWSLSEVVPVPPESIVNQLEFGTVALLLARADGRIDSADLSPEAHAFYQRIYATDTFSVKLQPGVSLLATVPIDDDSPFATPLRTLGTETPQLIVAGSLPGSIFGMSGGALALRAELPEMSPSLPNGTRPPWFRSGQLAFFIEVGPDGIAAGLDGTLNVTIDDTDMAFIVSGEFGGPPIAVTLAGALVTEQPWVAPFGQQWLTVRELGAALSFNPATASLGLGFHGDADIASKNAVVEMSLALNVTTGVPTSFSFFGQSTSTFGLADLADLQSQMSAGAPLPVNAIPNLEIRPVSTATPLEIRLALPLGGAAGVQPGIALKGALWAPLQGGAMTLVGEVDSDISRDGILIYGSVPHDIGVARLSLGEPVVDIDIALLPPGGTFVVTGNLTLPWFTKRIDVEIGGQGTVSAALEKVTDIVAAWQDFKTAFQQDPVAAVDAALRGPAGLFAVAGVPAPEWTDDLFTAIATMQEALPGSDPRAVLEAALAGADVTLPAGQGLPRGGVAAGGCLPGYTLHDGRCWFITPFAGAELGYSYICPTGVKEDNKCWIVPPSWTSTRAKVAKTRWVCTSTRLGVCTGGTGRPPTPALWVPWSRAAPATTRPGRRSCRVPARRRRPASASTRAASAGSSAKPRARAPLKAAPTSAARSRRRSTRRASAGDSRQRRRSRSHKSPASARRSASPAPSTAWRTPQCRA